MEEGAGVQNLERRVRRVERRMRTVDHHVDALVAKNGLTNTLVWAVKFVIDFITGTIGFLMWMVSFAWPIGVMILVALSAFYFRTVWADILFTLIRDTLKVILGIYNGIADVIRTIIKGIRALGFHHVHKRDVPHYHVSDVLGSDLNAFMKDPEGYCRGTVLGFQFVWGAIIRYASPETCHTCMFLSLADELEWLCKPVFFGDKMYAYDDMHCHIGPADYMCQALYLDVLVWQIIAGCLLAGAYLMYRDFLHDAFQAVWEVLYGVWELMLTLFRVATAASHSERWSHIHKRRVGFRQRMLKFMPHRLRPHYAHAAAHPKHAG